jgi:hypothetical protein
MEEQWRSSLFCGRRKKVERESANLAKMQKKGRVGWNLIQNEVPSATMLQRRIG